MRCEKKMHIKVSLRRPRCTTGIKKISLIHVMGVKTKHSSKGNYYFNSIKINLLFPVVFFPLIFTFDFQRTQLAQRVNVLRGLDGWNHLALR